MYIYPREVDIVQTTGNRLLAKMIFRLGNLMHPTMRKLISLIAHGNRRLWEVTPRWWCAWKCFLWSHWSLMTFPKAVYSIVVRLVEMCTDIFLPVIVIFILCRIPITLTSEGNDTHHVFRKTVVKLVTFWKFSVRKGSAHSYQLKRKTGVGYLCQSCTTIAATVKWYRVPKSDVRQEEPLKRFLPLVCL